MIRINEDDIKRFKWYIRNHVALVTKLGQLAFGIDLSHHDFDKQEADGEYLQTLSLRNHIHNTGEQPNNQEKEKINKAVAYHIKHNKHHPEYWDDSITEGNFDSDHYPQCNASKMTNEAITEMCCDWAAVAIKYNQPLDQWYNKVVDDRLKFTLEQKELIQRNMAILEKIIFNNNISFPGNGSYSAKIQKFKEDIQKDRRAVVVFAHAEPFTKAHLVTLNQIHEVEAEGKFLFLDHSNKLPYDHKINYTRFFLQESNYSDINVVHSNAITLPAVLKEIARSGYNQVTLFVDSDKVDFVLKKAQEFNVSKKKCYFDVIDVIALSKSKEAQQSSLEAQLDAANNNYDAFRMLIPTQHEDVCQDLYWDIKDHLN